MDTTEEKAALLISERSELTVAESAADANKGNQSAVTDNWTGAEQLL